MGLLKRLFEKLLPKKLTPQKVRINNSYILERDAYLDALLSRMEKNTKTVDADMYDKL